MSQDLSFSPEELDVLKEVANIGMGLAGSSLGEALGHYVHLRVPDIRVVQRDDLRETLSSFVDKYHAINVVRQAFFNDLQGESVLVFGGASFHALVELLGYREDDAGNKLFRQEMLQEIANAVNSACLQGIGAQLACDIQLSPPLVAGYEKSAADFYEVVFGKRDIPWQQTLLLEIQFHIQEKEFYCEIVILFAQESIQKIHAALVRLLA